MVIKWIKAMLVKPFTILKGTYYNYKKRNQLLAGKRLKICNECENKEEMPFIGDICGLCGCILESKTRLRNEKCLMNKW